MGADQPIGDEDIEALYGNTEWIMYCWKVRGNPGLPDRRCSPSL